MKNVNIVSSFKLRSRPDIGMVYVTDLDFDTYYSQFKEGDTFKSKDKVYQIISIGSTLQTNGDFITFIAKEI